MKEMKLRGCFPLLIHDPAAQKSQPLAAFSHLRRLALVDPKTSPSSRFVIADTSFDPLFWPAMSKEPNIEPSKIELGVRFLLYLQ